MDSLPIDHTLDYTNHEKMVIITRCHWKPLCTKGQQKKEKTVCENMEKMAVKSKQNSRISIKQAKKQRIFTMSENGRLKFQRSLRRYEKVRDHSSAIQLSHPARPDSSAIQLGQTVRNLRFAGDFRELFLPLLMVKSSHESHERQS